MSARFQSSLPTSSEVTAALRRVRVVQPLQLFPSPGCMECEATIAGIGDTVTLYPSTSPGAGGWLQVEYRGGGYWAAEPVRSAVAV